MEFVVLPDCPAGAAAAGRLRATRRVDHASGRPWIVGDWPEAEAVVVEAGPRRMVVLGHTRLDETAAAAALGRLRSLHDVDSIASRLPGAVHLAVSLDGRTRVQGSAVGVRQIFTAVVDGVTVAASGVEPLLRLTGAGLDETVLAARLLAPGGPPGRSPSAPSAGASRRSPPATGWNWTRRAGPGRPAGGNSRSRPSRSRRAQPPSVRRWTTRSPAGSPRAAPSAPTCPAVWTPPHCASSRTRPAPTWSRTT